MQKTLERYSYEVITSEQSNLIEKAAECLARSFIGVNVSGKWVQEPMVGQLDIRYEDFYDFTKDYLVSTVDQGYCVIAKDQNQNVVGVLAGDTNAPVIFGEDLFEGSFSDMNVILHVLEEIDQRFIDDYKKRSGKEIEDGEFLHLFMLGLTAEHDRHEVIQQLGNELITKAASQGLKAVIGEATNPKSIRVMEKYHQMEKYIDIGGHYIVHKYKENNRLSGIDESIADGTYFLIREL